jgi:uncharacterized membrane protein YdbT with pleckstrin-like domain
VIFLRPVLIFIVALFFKVGGDYAFIRGLLIFLAIIAGIGQIITFITSEFIITNKRVIAKIGLIRRKSIEVLLNKVEGIQVNQGILARILGYGTITVGGTGGTKDPFKNIRSPIEFRKKAQEQIASIQDSKQKNQY